MLLRNCTADNIATCKTTRIMFATIQKLLTSLPADKFHQPRRYAEIDAACRVGETPSPSEIPHASSNLFRIDVQLTAHKFKWTRGNFPASVFDLPPKNFVNRRRDFPPPKIFVNRRRDFPPPKIFVSLRRDYPTQKFS